MRNNIPNSHFYTSFVVILILSDISISASSGNGFEISNFWTLRRRVLAVESTVDPNVTVQVFPIVEYTWESSDFPKDGIRGYLINAFPLNACTGVEPPPGGMFDEDTATATVTDNGTVTTATAWFLLANNDDCDLETKKGNAAEAGFSALILPNKNNRNKIDPGKESTQTDSPAVEDKDNVSVEPKTKKCNNDTLNDETVENECNDGEIIENHENEEEVEVDIQSASAITNVYALTLAETDWFILRTNFTYPEPYIAKIEDSPSITLFIIGVSVVALILLIFFVGCVISIKKLISAISEYRRVRQIVRRNKLLIATVQSLPIRKWTRALDTLSEENKVCKICTENFTDDEEIRVLPCCHIFHLICVDQWILEGRPFCNVCKVSLVSPSLRVSPQSDLSQASDTLQPVYAYASCESTRLLIPNAGHPSRGSGNNSPAAAPLRVMAIMPEVFDASFEAMLPLRSPCDEKPGGNALEGTTTATNQEGSSITVPPRTSPNLRTQESLPHHRSPKSSRGGNQKPQRKEISSSPSHSHFHTNPNVPSDTQNPSGNIYISEREDFV